MYFCNRNQWKSLLRLLVNDKELCEIANPFIREDVAVLAVKQTYEQSTNKCQQAIDGRHSSLLNRSTRERAILAARNEHTSKLSMIGTSSIRESTILAVSK